jgi:hypothetical protein
MFINYWLDRSMATMEKELILVKQSPNTQAWFNKMPSIIPACCPLSKTIKSAEEYGPKVGQAHHLRMTKYGIEGVLKAARKYHRYSFYVFYNSVFKPNEPFWIVFHRDQ